MERDAESGLDHTQFRQYSSGLGRWLSPDPLFGNVSNPECLNRYAYVLNNPTTSTDPLGLLLMVRACWDYEFERSNPEGDGLLVWGVYGICSSSFYPDAPAGSI